MKCTESRGCGVKFKKFCSGTVPWAFHTSQEVSRYRGRNRLQALQQSLTQAAKIGELHLSTLLDLSFFIWVVLGAVVGPGVGARGKLSIFRFILWLVGDIHFSMLLACASMKTIPVFRSSICFPLSEIRNYWQSALIRNNICHWTTATVFMNLTSHQDTKSAESIEILLEFKQSIAGQPWNINNRNKYRSPLFKHGLILKNPRRPGRI